jgi:hypothetical protein
MVRASPRATATNNVDLGTGQEELGLSGILCQVKCKDLGTKEVVTWRKTLWQLGVCPTSIHFPHAVNCPAV